MQLDRKIFYNEIRPIFLGGKLLASEVVGMEVIFDEWEAGYTTRTPIPQLAYCLATPFHETNQKMQPINELGDTAYFTRMYDIRGSRPSVARTLGNIFPGDGSLFHGRGLVQLTGRKLYLTATRKLQSLGYLKPSESLVDNPALALRSDVAVALLFEGMEDGWFTGIDLDETIDANVEADEHAEYIKARRIINGTDRANLIAGYADHFLAALQKAIAA